VPGEKDSPGTPVHQQNQAGRDVYAADHDQTVNIYYPAAGPGRPQKLATDGRVVVGDIPQQPPGFQPRTRLIAELGRLGSGMSVVAAVTGMRGVGKTQLAAAYARAKLAEGWRLVAWVNAEDRVTLAAGLAAIAEVIGLAGQAAGQGAVDAGRVVRHWLEADGDRRLIVFDNVTDADVLRPYVPAGGAARVIITSNRQSVANLGTRLGVEVFTRGEAVAFFAERTGLTDTAGAEMVAAELGCLPLALAQAASVIAGQYLSYGTYLERLRALPVEEYLIREPGQPYPHGTAEAVVLLALESVRAERQGGLYAEVLEMMSVLSAAGVRRDLMYAAGQTGVLRDGAAGAGARLSADVVDGALGRLAERSLVTFSLDSQAIVAHRLVLRVVREQLAKQGRLAAVCRAVASALEARAKALEDSLDRVAVRDVPEQVAALQDAVAGVSGRSDPELTGALLRLRSWAVYHLGVLGDSAQQMILIGEPLATDYERELGADHPHALDSRNNLANAYLNTGRTAEAMALFEQVLSTRDRVQGPDHPDTLGSRNNLAEAYRAAGRTAEATGLLEQNLAARERVLGPDHRATMGSRNNLAAAYREAGRTAEATGLLERNLAARERVLGPDHPDTLAARNNLAAVYDEAGRTAEAIALLEQLLAVQERMLDPNHPDTLTSRSNLADAYLAAGRTGEAITLHEHVLAARERIRGPDHPDILQSRNNLAIAYVQVARVAEAIALFEQVLAARERMLGPDHPATLTSRNNLAHAYLDASRAD
jgi:tetratricopeptide (TPR) repeat protein